jgi:hypothetical protein
MTKKLNRGLTKHDDLRGNCMYIVYLKQFMQSRLLKAFLSTVEFGSCYSPKLSSHKEWIQNKKHHITGTHIFVLIVWCLDATLFTPIQTFDFSAHTLSRAFKKSWIHSIHAWFSCDSIFVQTCSCSKSNSCRRS